MTISFMSFFTTFVLQNDSELYGRTLRVNAAKPLRLKESSTRPVWADDEWLQKYSGQVSLICTWLVQKAFILYFIRPLQRQKQPRMGRQRAERARKATRRERSGLRAR